MINIILVIHSDSSGMFSFDSMILFQNYTWYWTPCCECHNIQFQCLFVNLRTLVFCPRFFKPQRWTSCVRWKQDCGSVSGQDMVLLTSIPQRPNHAQSRHQQSTVVWSWLGKVQLQYVQHSECDQRPMIPWKAEKTMWALLEVTKNGKIGPEDVGIVWLASVLVIEFLSKPDSLVNLSCSQRAKLYRWWYMTIILL